jgi:hypothetical protein
MLLTEGVLRTFVSAVGILGSSDGPETSHLEYIHSWFSSALPGKYRDIYLKYAPTASAHVLSKSLFLNHLLNGLCSF